MCADQILIYGAGMVGKRLLRQMQQQNLSVAGFIDRRGKEIKTLEKIPVYSLEELQNRFQQKENYLIFLTIKNVFQHNEIVMSLRSMGFEYFVFKPASILQGCNKNEELIIVNRIYEKVVETEGTLAETVPSCKGVRLLELRDWGFLSEQEGFVTAYLPAELLFTNWNPDNPQWSVQNILAAYAAVDMYRGFSGKNGKHSKKLIDCYMQEIALAGAQKMGLNTDGLWEESVREGRRRVYWEMRRKMAFWPEFFIENSVLMKRRENNSFELISSGKNRVSFLIAEGMTVIPVRMKKNEYTIFLNAKVANRLYTYLEKRPEIRPFAPISHPYFYYVDSMAPDYLENWLGRIGKFIARWLYDMYGMFDFSKLTIQSLLPDQGASCRYFSLLGCKVINSCKGNDEMRELLDDLFFAEYSNRYENNRDEEVDICFLHTDNLNEESLLPYLKQCKSFCFLQSCEDKSWVNEMVRRSEFSILDKLFEAYWGTKLVNCYLLGRGGKTEYREYLYG